MRSKVFNYAALLAWQGHQEMLTLMVGAGTQPPVEAYELCLAELEKIYTPQNPSVKLTVPEQGILDAIKEHRKILVATITKLHLMRDNKLPTAPVGFVFPDQSLSGFGDDPIKH
jgi:hypothetical protein